MASERDVWGGNNWEVKANEMAGCYYHNFPISIFYETTEVMAVSEFRHKLLGVMTHLMPETLPESIKIIIKT